MVVIPYEFSDAIALTANSSTDLTSLSLTGFYAGATGDITVVSTKPGSAAVTFKAVPAGTVIHVPIKALNTGTSVVGLVGK